MIIFRSFCAFVLHTIHAQFSHKVQHEIWEFIVRLISHNSFRTLKPPKVQSPLSTLSDNNIINHWCKARSRSQYGSQPEDTNELSAYRSIVYYVGRAEGVRMSKNQKTLKQYA